MPLAPQGFPEANRTIWVGGVEHWMDEVYLNNAFSVVCPIKNVKLVRDPHRRNLPVGYAFIQFADREPVVELLDRLNGELFTGIDGQRFRINWATYGIGENRGPSEQDVSLYVGNLDTMINDMQLFRIFAKRYRSVVAAKVITDPAFHTSRGYGFVRFRDPDEAESALVQMQGQQCGLKAMKIKKAIGKGCNFPAQHLQQQSQPPSAAPAAAPAACGAAAAGAPLDGASSAAPPPPPPPPAPVRPVGHPIVIPGVYAGWSESDLAYMFGIFGAVFRVQVQEDRGTTTIEFRDKMSAEIAIQHLQDQAGVQAAMAEAVSDVHMAAPAITNMTTTKANGHIQAHLQVQLQNVAQPSMEHFFVLLQDPFFVGVFEEQVALRQAADASGEKKAVQLPWSLQDRPGLFVDGRPSVQQMNADFVPSFGSPRAAALGGRCAPLLPQGMRIVL